MTPATDVVPAGAVGAAVSVAFVSANAHVPVVVIVPPLNPVPHVTLVTVPVPVLWFLSLKGGSKAVSGLIVAAFWHVLLSAAGCALLPIDDPTQHHQVRP
jgi:hypothetical protein